MLLRHIIAKLLTVVPPADPDRVRDEELLSRYARDRDQAAFELLVWRYGSLVWSVCRRIVRDHHLAEDAFQATFLILAKKAISVRGASLAGWLHQVASRVAVRANLKQNPTQALNDEWPDRESPDREGLAIIDEEINRLPERLRLPLILCYLQEWSTDEAASHLGIPRGTVLSRLSTARAKLAGRLTKRGIAVPTLMVFAVSADRITAVTLQTHAPSGAAFVLAQEVLSMTSWKPITMAALALIACAGLGSGLVVVTAQNPKSSEPVKQTPSIVDRKPELAKEQEKREAELRWARVKKLEEVLALTKAKQAELQSRLNLMPSISTLRLQIKVLQDTCEINQKDYIHDEEIIVFRKSQIREYETANEEYYVKHQYSNPELRLKYWDKKSQSEKDQDREGWKKNIIKQTLSDIESIKSNQSLNQKKIDMKVSQIDQLTFQLQNRVSIQNQIDQYKIQVAEMEHLQTLYRIDPDQLLPRSLYQSSPSSDASLRSEVEELRQEVVSLKKLLQEKK